MQPEPSSQLSHVDSEGKAHMVDISNKSETLRTATALARIIISEEAFKVRCKNTVLYVSNFSQ